MFIHGCVSFGVRYFEVAVMLQIFARRDRDEAVVVGGAVVEQRLPVSQRGAEQRARKAAEEDESSDARRGAEQRQARRR